MILGDGHTSNMSLVSMDVDGVNDRFALGGYFNSTPNLPLIGSFDIGDNDWLWLKVLSGGSPALTSIQEVTYNLNFTKIAFLS